MVVVMNVRSPKGGETSTLNYSACGRFVPAEYFTLGGKSSGTVKPENAGVYLLKQGSFFWKIIVK
jgi:hypothetical protein